ncbi:MAG: DNA-directed DNA polymerase II small subunit [Candidatus Micrarchaeaceae archaeon]
MNEEIKKEFVNYLSKSNIMLEAGALPLDLAESEVNTLAEAIISIKTATETGSLKIVSKEDIEKALQNIRNNAVAKMPEPIEINRTASFKPIAAEVEAIYKIEPYSCDRVEGSVNDFISYFRDRLNKIRNLFDTPRYSIIENIALLKNFTEGRQVAICGIVSNKIVTKNGNIMVILEDETGEVKVIFMNSSSLSGKKIFESASKIITDEVLVVVGKISGPFVIASELLWPDIPIKEQKVIEDDIAIAFISDIHVGSKLFMEKNFTKMLEWINGNVNSKSRSLAGKIKYIIIGGDIVDGIGIYPGQERDLAVTDIYKQYSIMSRFLENLPEYIQIFILPGNHDAVQRSEPQPEFPDKFLEIKQSNVHKVPNPLYINLHGLDVVSYHGASLDSIIGAIPGMSYAKPEEAMIELLKRRHLSPIYGGNMIVPSKNDSLVMQRVPDILHMGHIHKNGIANYHGTLVINSGTWQSRTDFQIKQGHIPTPCNLPVFEAKDYKVTTIDFSGVI